MRFPKKIVRYLIPIVLLFFVGWMSYFLTYDATRRYSESDGLQKGHTGSNWPNDPFEVVDDANSERTVKRQHDRGDNRPDKVKPKVHLKYGELPQDLSYEDDEEADEKDDADAEEGDEAKFSPNKIGKDDTLSRDSAIDKYNGRSNRKRIANADDAQREEENDDEVQDDSLSRRKLTRKPSLRLNSELKIEKPSLQADSESKIEKPLDDFDSEAKFDRKKPKSDDDVDNFKDDLQEMEVNNNDLELLRRHKQGRYAIDDSSVRRVVEKKVDGQSSDKNSFKMNVPRIEPKQPAAVVRVVTRPATRPTPPNPERDTKMVKVNYEYYYLIHSNKASRIHSQIHANIKSLPDHIPSETYTFTSERSVPS